MGGVKAAFVLLASANIIYTYVEDAVKIEDLFELCLLNWKVYNIDYKKMLSMRYHQQAPRACALCTLTVRTVRRMVGA